MEETHREELHRMLEFVLEKIESMSEEEFNESYQESLNKAQAESKALHEARKVDHASLHKPCTI